AIALVTAVVCDAIALRKRLAHVLPDLREKHRLDALEWKLCLRAEDALTDIREKLSSARQPESAVAITTANARLRSIKERIREGMAAIYQANLMAETQYGLPFPKPPQNTGQRADFSQVDEPANEPRTAHPRG